MLRNVLAVFVGFVTGGVVVFAIEKAGHSMYPPPSSNDPEVLAEYVATAPTGALLFVLAGAIGGSFAAGWVAGAISRRMRPPTVIGILFLVAAIVNFTLIPHPLWLAGLMLVSYLPCARAGGRLGIGKSRS